MFLLTTPPFQNSGGTGSYAPPVKLNCRLTRLHPANLAKKPRNKSAAFGHRFFKCVEIQRRVLVVDDFPCPVFKRENIGQPCFQRGVVGLVAVAVPDKGERHVGADMPVHHLAFPYPARVPEPLFVDGVAFAGAGERVAVLDDGVHRAAAGKMGSERLQIPVRDGIEMVVQGFIEIGLHGKSRSHD